MHYSFCIIRSQLYPYTSTIYDAALHTTSHFGYHIYAAAILSEFDREWGRTHFEEVLLLIRDIANPSVKDTFFPVFRQKDW